MVLFEWDPRLIAEVKAGDPDQLWSDLAEFGYTRVVVWDNGGDPLGQLEAAEMSRPAQALTLGGSRLGYTFWDLAVCRENDHVATAAFGRLVPGRFTAPARRDGVDGPPARSR